MLNFLFLFIVPTHHVNFFFTPNNNVDFFGFFLLHQPI